MNGANSFYSFLEKKNDLGIHSELFLQLTKLKESSKEAVENANSFSSFKSYLHVRRTIEEDLEEVLRFYKDQTGPKLILLCGSVGDGKSHLLAYLKQKKPEIVDSFHIHNDATESFDPKKTAIDTLEEVLMPFSDTSLPSSSSKMILAINLGILSKFIEAQKSTGRFRKLEKAIDNSRIFESNIAMGKYEDEYFCILSFSDYHLYELTEDGPRSEFIATILERLTTPNSNNPFYLAYQRDKKKGIDNIIHRNYEILMNRDVQIHLVQLLIEASVKEKMTLQARSILNFLADILIPPDYEYGKTYSEIEMVERLMPNLLFSQKERSPILRALYKLDPLHHRSREIDELIIRIYLADEVNEVYTEYFGGNDSLSILENVYNNQDLKGDDKEKLVKAFIRSAYIISKEFYANNRDLVYELYMDYLFSYNKKDIMKLSDLYDEVIQAIFFWNGSPKKGYIFLDRGIERFKVAQRLELEPEEPDITPTKGNILRTFKQTMLLKFQGNPDVQIDIDYHLFKLLQMVLKGYSPNKVDSEDAVQLVDFINRSMKLNKQEEILLCIPGQRNILRLSKSLGQVRLERE